MGALAPVFSWMPEDDVLLKNAVEAGASLESLAKGAVQFSRRFTVQELQDRWYSLLYDPVLSLEAATRMIECDDFASDVQSKSNKFDYVKENKCFLGKRKQQSVRKCYYAMRKRICSEPFDPLGGDFLIGPCNDNYIGDGPRSSDANCMLEGPTPNYLQLQEPIRELSNHSIAAFKTEATSDSNDGANIDAFHIGFQDSVENRSACQLDVKEMPNSFEENLSLTDNCYTVAERGQANGFPVFNLYEDDEFEINYPEIFDQIENREGNMCSSFEGGKILNSPVSNCGTTFDSFEYSSSPPQMPIWSRDSAPAPSFPNFHIGGKEHHMGNMFALPCGDDVNDTNLSEYNSTLSDLKPKNQVSCDNMTYVALGTDDYLADLSNSLFEFTEEEEIFEINADVKEAINEISSLLDSPDEEVASITVSEVPIAPYSHVTVPENSRPVEVLDDEQHPFCNNHIQFSAEDPETKILPSVSAVKVEFPEMCAGVVHCILNTEDTEIPSNDDVFLLNRMSSPTSAAQWKLHETIYPMFLSVADLSGAHESDDGQSPIKRERISLKHSHASSQIIGSFRHPEMDPSISVGDCGDELGLACCDGLHSCLRNPGTREDHTSTSALLNEKKNLTIAKEEVRNIGVTQVGYESGDYLEMQSHGFESHVHLAQRNFYRSEQEVDTLINTQRQEALYTSGCRDISIPNLNPYSDQEESPSDSDGDVPYFSDVEAMILDMDLTPKDNSLYFCKKVSKYQHEESKRSIIRLEQAANAFMKRVIASHGAYAVLYGRYSKHYIRKPEVVLGRMTEDTEVDIDLSREGRANKISRRQAIIKMDKGGSFHLKNIGKRSVFINDKEVAPGQISTLIQSCLIEARRRYGQAPGFKGNHHPCNGLIKLWELGKAIKQQASRR